MEENIRKELSVLSYKELRKKAKLYSINGRATVSFFYTLKGKKYKFTLYKIKEHLSNTYQ